MTSERVRDCAAGCRDPRTASTRRIACLVVHDDLSAAASLWRTRFARRQPLEIVAAIGWFAQLVDDAQIVGLSRRDVAGAVACAPAGSVTWCIVIAGQALVFPIAAYGRLARRGWGVVWAVLGCDGAHARSALRHREPVAALSEALRLVLARRLAAAATAWSSA